MKRVLVFLLVALASLPAFAADEAPAPEGIGIIVEINTIFEPIGGISLPIVNIFSRMRISHIIIDEYCHRIMVLPKPVR